VAPARISTQRCGDQGARDAARISGCQPACRMAAIVVSQLAKVRRLIDHLKAYLVDNPPGDKTRKAFAENAVRRAMGL
jgi:hypothetical protein